MLSLQKWPSEGGSRENREIYYIKCIDFNIYLCNVSKNNTCTWSTIKLGSNKGF